METVVLKNGTTEAASLVAVIMMTLTDLFKKNPMMLYELNEVCKDPTHKIWGDFGVELRRRDLLQQNFQPHSSIKNIVLCAIEGEGLDMTLGNPVGPDKPAPKIGIKED